MRRDRARARSASGATKPGSVPVGPNRSGSSAGCTSAKLVSSATASWTRSGAAGVTPSGGSSATSCSAQPGGSSGTSKRPSEAAAAVRSSAAVAGVTGVTSSESGMSQDGSRSWISPAPSGAVVSAVRSLGRLHARRGLQLEERVEAGRRLRRRRGRGRLRGHGAAPRRGRAAPPPPPGGRWPGRSARRAGPARGAGRWAGRAAPAPGARPWAAPAAPAPGPAAPAAAPPAAPPQARLLHRREVGLGGVEVVRDDHRVARGPVLDPLQHLAAAGRRRRLADRLGARQELHHLLGEGEGIDRARQHHRARRRGVGLAPSTTMGEVAGGRLAGELHRQRHRLAVLAGGADDEHVGAAVRHRHAGVRRVGGEHRA